MQRINMTPACAELLSNRIKKVLEADNGLELREIVIRAGDPSGRDEKPTDTVDFSALYEETTLPE